MFCSCCLFVPCSGVSFVLLRTWWQTMLLHERTSLNHQSPCFHFHQFSYSYVYVGCIFSLVFNLLTGKTERKTLFFSLFRNIFSSACDDNSDYVVLMQPQLLVLFKKVGGVFTDNHPSLLLPRPTNKAITVFVFLAVSYIYTLYPPQARHPLRVDGLTPDWERMVSFGCSTNAAPARAPCLHCGVMDSVAADTVPISPSCPAPWGQTVIARLHAAAAAPYMAQAKKRKTRMTHHSGEMLFLFSGKVRLSSLRRGTRLPDFGFQCAGTALISFHFGNFPLSCKHSDDKTHTRTHGPRLVLQSVTDQS